MATATREDLLQDVDAVVWEADPVTLQFRYVSLAATRLLGYPPEDWLTRPRFLLEILHPDDLERALDHYRIAISECRDLAFECRMLAADGRVLWMRNILRVTSLAGKTERLGGVLLDVTGRKHAETAWDRRDRLSRALLEHTVDIIAVIDRDGEIQYVSPSVERVLGVKAESRIGRLIFDDVHADDIVLVRDAFEAAFRTRQPTPPVRVRYRHANGSWRLIEAMGRIFVDDGREVAIVNSRDITERSALEEQVSHGQRMSALDKLTGSIAHDFNNVLLSIRGFVDLAMDAPDTEAARGELVEILKVVDVGSALVTQLRTFSGNPPPEVEIVDVLDALERQQPSITRLLGQGVEFDPQFQAPAAKVRLKNGELEQIVMQLAVNAKQAMPGGGRFELRTHIDPWGPVRKDGTFGDLMIEAEDSGSGIAPEILAKIFDEGFTTKPHAESAGLGLSTVKAIVTRAGGTISVKSDVGKGSIFTVKLPLA